MIFKRLNRTSPEQVFAVFQASEAGIAADDVVMLDTSSNDGVNVEQPTGAHLNLVVGIADAAIANSAYGLVQIYGYRSTSRVVHSGASVTPGQPLEPVADADYLRGGASVPAAYLAAFAAIDSLVSSGTTATVSLKIFIRAM